MKLSIAQLLYIGRFNNMSVGVHGGTIVISFLLFSALFGALIADATFPAREEYRVDIPRADHGNIDDTGDLSLSIPLMDVPIRGEKSFPIAINYRSGIKPDSPDSWVGLGWSLDFGRATRSAAYEKDYMWSPGVAAFILQGEPDESIIAVLNNRLPDEISVSNGQGGATFINLNQNLGPADGEMISGAYVPDFKSGKWSAQKLEPLNVQIDREHMAGAWQSRVDYTGFVLTDIDGTRYIYDLPLKESEGEPGEHGNFEWLLTTILYPDYVDGGNIEGNYDPLDSMESNTGMWVKILYEFDGEGNYQNGYTTDIVTVPIVGSTLGADSVYHHSKKAFYEGIGHDSIGFSGGNYREITYPYKVITPTFTAVLSKKDKHWGNTESHTRGFENGNNPWFEGHGQYGRRLDNVRLYRTPPEPTNDLGDAFKTVTLVYHDDAFASVVSPGAAGHPLSKTLGLDTGKTTLVGILFQGTNAVSPNPDRTYLGPYYYASNQRWDLVGAYQNGGTASVFATPELSYPIAPSGNGGPGMVRCEVAGPDDIRGWDSCLALLTQGACYRFKGVAQNDEPDPQIPFPVSIISPGDGLCDQSYPGYEGGPVPTESYSYAFEYWDPDVFVSRPQTPRNGENNRDIFGHYDADCGNSYNSCSSSYNSNYDGDGDAIYFMAHADGAKAWSLKRIRFPARGTAEYFYEDDRYRGGDDDRPEGGNQFENSDKTYTNGGVRVNKILLNDARGGSQEIRYTYGGGDGPIGPTDCRTLQGANIDPDECYGYVTSYPDDYWQYVLMGGFGGSRNVFTVQDGARHEVLYRYVTEHRMDNPALLHSSQNPRIVREYAAPDSNERKDQTTINRVYRAGLFDFWFVYSLDRGWKRGQPASEHYYRASNDENDWVKKAVYQNAEDAAHHFQNNIADAFGLLREYQGDTYYPVVIDESAVSRLMFAVTNDFGIVSNVTYEYNSVNGLVSREIRRGDGVPTIDTRTEYAFETNDAMRGRNMLSQVRKVDVHVDGALKKSSITDYGNFTGLLTQQLACVDSDGDGFATMGGDSYSCPDVGQDCDDTDSRVHPGQEQYFNEISNGGVWDYDCDGQVEFRLPEAEPAGEFCAHVQSSWTPGWGRRVGDTEVQRDVGCYPPPEQCWPDPFGPVLDYCKQCGETWRCYEAGNDGACSHPECLEQDGGFEVPQTRSAYRR